MQILRAEQRTTREEFLKVMAERNKEIAEQGKDTIKTIMFAVIGSTGLIIAAISVATVILGFWLQPGG